MVHQNVDVMQKENNIIFIIENYFESSIIGENAVAVSLSDHPVNIHGKLT